MKYKIAFFTEGQYHGKVKRDNRNMRTDLAWICSLEADHYPIQHPNSFTGNGYDIGIIIIPKKNPEKLWDVLPFIKGMCDKVGVMQEGPNWIWQDYSMENQIWYYNTLTSVDFILCHNEIDISYFKGLTKSENVHKLPTLMLTDFLELSGRIDDIPKADDVMIGGNMTSWYGGMDSLMIASEMDKRIFAPSMGRKLKDEEGATDVQYLPYMQWSDWMFNLARCSYGVHMMRTFAAGTFALNCAYLGIPCIGYEALDTQRLCHRFTSVGANDLDTARMIAKELKENKKFYDRCSEACKTRYEDIYNEKVFLETMENTFDIIFNTKGDND